MRAGRAVSRRSVLIATASLPVAATLVNGRPRVAGARVQNPAAVHTQQVNDAHPADALIVSSLGHDVLDSTQFLQAALDSTAATIVIDKIPGGWTTGPLFLNRGDVTIIVDPDVMVKAKAGAFVDIHDSLLTIKDVSNVSLSGYGATFSMQKKEYTSGEFRMALSVLGVHHLTLEGLTLRDSGGDGIYLGRGDTNVYCADVVMRDLECTNNRRNSMSVITVDGLTVEGCTFARVQGTAPECGIDFEPNTADERIANVTITDCLIDANTSYGVTAYLGAFDSTSVPVSVLVDRSTIRHQIGEARQLPCGVLMSSARNGCTGQLELRNSLIDMAPASSAIGSFNNDAHGVELVFRNVTVWDWGNAAQTSAPIVVDSGLQAAYGGLTFDDAVYVTDQPPPLLQANDHDPDHGFALTNIHGVLTVVDPSGVSVNDGDNPPVDYDLQINTEPAGLNACVDVTASSANVQGGEDVQLTFTRSGSDLSTSLAIAYKVSGSARERYDFGGLGRVAVIRAGEQMVTVTVRTFARRQTTDPVSRSLVVALTAGYRYEAGGQAPATVIITG